MELTLRWSQGSLLLVPPHGTAEGAVDPGLWWQWDLRADAWRAEGLHYRDAFAALWRGEKEGRWQLVDQARGYGEVALAPVVHRTPRSYQQEAVDAWDAAGRRGLVVLPTGAGKSHVAHMAMQQAGRSTLIVVPTLDLVHQWYSGLLSFFGLDRVGLLGGGERDLQPITVSTYDSAALQMAWIGHRFGLVIWDEVHHLASPTWLQAARMCMAPWRLGLTATPERSDGREGLLEEVVGPVVYQRGIRELAGDFLADYVVERWAVELTEDEAAIYHEARQTYLDFLRRSGVRLDGPQGWSGFLRRAMTSAEGRAAVRAWRLQRQVSLTCHHKLRLVETLLLRHAGERVLLFTADNATVYALSRRLLLPAITHQTPVRERREILQRFADGTYRAILTSKVLNEGVDVPEASVAIVLGGTGSVREHVQRLGRVLRKVGDKRALLYELVSAGTVEENTSERRREHDAYR